MFVAVEVTVNYHNLPKRMMTEGGEESEQLCDEGGREGRREGSELTALVSSLSLGEEPKYRPP